MAKQKSSICTPKQAILISSFIAITLLTAGFAIKVWYFDQYIRAAHIAETAQTRDLVLAAVTNLKTDAPIDAKTGDIYFPEAKLFVPQNQAIFGGLRYDVKSGTNGADLSVSSRALLNKTSVPLITAQNTEIMFKAVPKLQACSRGVLLVYTPMSADESADKTLSQTVELNNGKKLYMYTEKTCPELKDLASALKNIQAY